MRFQFVTAACIAFATSAQAECPGGANTFLSCTVSNGRKALDVCSDDFGARYSFGTPGDEPDLTMSVRYRELEYTPWPGIGRAVWEAVTFHNGDFSYEVSGRLSREPDAATADETDQIVDLGGQVVVSEGENVISRLMCDAGSVDFPWTDTLSAGKRAAGLEFDNTTGTWMPVAN